MRIHSFTIKTIPTLFLMAHAVFTAGAEAQSMANFESRGLMISGGEETAKNNSATIYHGSVDINKEGKISGRISRREFAATRTNSVSKPMTIVGSIFNTVIKIAEDSQTETNSTGKIITKSALYAADFHITTSLTNFMIKGRALQQVTTSVAEYTEDGRSVRTTNKDIDVSLQGVNLGARGMRGFFNAD